MHGTNTADQKTCKISWSRLTFATLRHFEILYPLWTYDPLIIFDPYFAWFRRAKAAALEAWLDQTCLGELSSTNAHGTTIEDWQMMIHNELWWCNGRTQTISDFGDRWSPHVSTWPFVIFCPGGRPSTSDFARLGAFAPCVKLLDLPWSSRLEAVIWQVCCLKWDYVDLVRSCFYLHLIRFVNRFLHGSAVRLRVSSPCPGTLQLLRGLARHIIEALTVSQSQRLPAAFAPLRQCQRLRQQH